MAKCYAPTRSTTATTPPAVDSRPLYLHSVPFPSGQDIGTVILRQGALPSLKQRAWPYVLKDRGVVPCLQPIRLSRFCLKNHKKASACSAQARGYRLPLPRIVSDPGLVP